ncbi:hypothetical protein [Pseudobdellovibrio exovorus]|uniref:Hydantoin utilization protein n=1 Tax=Pseudobdellovibrio exovorus JSS TaxID=1184267 RepID=M4V6R1_9BACT|nr:hypothetical protein [Pseudobdellovibrio exovorus]AGH95052.1 hydantoin utilization protein [Pseudobdellovibrio exovorus JSS]
MMSKLAVALYLGESYATIGLFDISQSKTPTALFEKSIFLPQVSLKSLLGQVKQHIKTSTGEDDPELPVFIVTKYFDRLRQFRLGGSISQVILKDFENSYTLTDSKALSLAATQLIIPIDPQKVTEAYLTEELSRVKKVNPELNKVVIALPANRISDEKQKLITDFFQKAELKIFHCPSPENQSVLRKTLLNAGSEGTKEEIIDEVKENLSAQAQISFFCQNKFQTNFENCELFGSASDFLSFFVSSHKHSFGAYFDIESLKFINSYQSDIWNSPWGSVQIKHREHIDLGVHPFTELKLNHLSIMDTEPHAIQFEPGPVVAGRAIKPLMLDLFHADLQKNDLASNLFSQISQDTLKAKIQNLLSVLEKGQKNPHLSLKLNELKQNLIDNMAHEILFHSEKEKPLLFGPLVDVFGPDTTGTRVQDFSWPKEIIKAALAV